MRWIVRLLVVYAVVLVVGIVAVAATSMTGDGRPAHSRMDPVSHNAYELHKSIGEVP